MQRKLSLTAAALLLAPALVLIAQQQQEKVDLNVLHKIKEAEIGTAGGGGGFGGAPRSQVMEIMHNLTDHYGPRLTNSPQFKAAGAWAVETLKKWELSNVHLEKWATPEDNKIPVWEVKGYSGAMVEPTYMSIIGVPQAWTGSTSGTVTGDAILAAQPASQADIDKLHGKLKGKIVLVGAGPIDLPFPTTPLARRYTDTELTELVPEVFPTGGRGGRGGAGARGGRGGFPTNMTPEEAQAFQAKLRTFWKDEGVAVILQASARGESGTLFGGGAQTRMDTTNLPTVSITAEHFNRIARLLEHNVPVKLQFDIKTQFDTSNTDSFNVIAEIPGSSKPNEIVMVGGHFDSWHYGTGATDNAAGSAVAMEVMRILKSLNLRMDRTVRMALWGGEEEGLLGSRAYVKEHFADPTTMKPTTEHSNFSSYFNIDNGTGKIRGIYLQKNEMARPIFESWFAALKDMAPGTITIRQTGGTDHQAYESVGLPGFQFIQDPMDYDTRTHHSNMDVYDRIQPGDMEQMAIIEAFFVYSAATRPDKFPRNDLPAPVPARGGRGGRGGN